MDILYLMVMCSVSLAVVFLIIFIISAKRGQFEDDESPAVRILLDKDEDSKSSDSKHKKNKKKENLVEEKSE